MRELIEDLGGHLTEAKLTAKKAAAMIVKANDAERNLEIETSFVDLANTDRATVARRNSLAKELRKLGYAMIGSGALRPVEGAHEAEAKLKWKRVREGLYEAKLPNGDEVAIENYGWMISGATGGPEHDPGEYPNKKAAQDYVRKYMMGDNDA